MNDRMTAAEFRALVSSGAIIPTRRGLISAEPEAEIARPADVRKKKRIEEAVKKVVEIGDKKSSRTKKKSAFKPGIIRPDFIETAVKVWGKRNAIFIPYDVSSLKNSKQIVPYMDRDGHPKFSLQPSKACRTYKKAASPYWISARDAFEEKLKGLSFPLVIGFYFIRRRNDEFDYHNMVQYPLDLMRDFGWIPDDSNLYTIGFPMGHEIEPKCPGVAVFVFPLKTLPFIGHPYDKAGYPKAFMPTPSRETLALWEGFRNRTGETILDFYEEEDDSDLSLSIEDGVITLAEIEDENEE